MLTYRPTPSAAGCGAGTNAGGRKGVLFSNPESGELERQHKVLCQHQSKPACYRVHGESANVIQVNAATEDSLEACTKCLCLMGRRVYPYKMCFSGSQCAGASSTRARRVAVSLSPGLPHRNVGLGEILRAPRRSGAQVLPSHLLWSGACCLNARSDASPSGAVLHIMSAIS